MLTLNICIRLSLYHILLLCFYFLDNLILKLNNFLFCERPIGHSNSKYINDIVICRNIRIGYNMFMVICFGFGSVMFRNDNQNMFSQIAKILLQSMKALIN